MQRVRECRRDRATHDEAIRITADNPGAYGQGEARVAIAGALAREQRFVEAAGAAGMTSIEGFIQRVASWADAIEAVHPGGVPVALRRVLRVAAWAAPD